MTLLKTLLLFRYSLVKMNKLKNKLKQNKNLLKSQPSQWKSLLNKSKRLNKSQKLPKNLKNSKKRKNYKNSWKNLVLKRPNPKVKGRKKRRKISRKKLRKKKPKNNRKLRKSRLKKFSNLQLTGNFAFMKRTDLISDEEKSGWGS